MMQSLARFRKPASISANLLMLFAISSAVIALDSSAKSTAKPQTKAASPTETKASAASASTIKVDFSKSAGSTVFHAVGRPSAIKINGTGAPPKGTLAWSEDGKLSGNLTFDLTTLTTGIDMRDKHMKEKYLEVGKYPTATLTISDVTLGKDDFSKDFSKDQVPFKGTLLLHGTSKPVSGTAHIERHGNASKTIANFSVKITDFGIPVPSFAGITVADEVAVVVDATADVSKQ